MFKPFTLSLFLLAITMISGIANAAVNTANCNVSTFSNVPVPDNALSISINAVALVPTSGSLPQYCDVQGNILTTPPVVVGDEEIQFEVKMPTVWNNKFLMHGNGGNGGSISFATAAIFSPGVDGDTFPHGFGLTQGYTIAATDTGHFGSSTIDFSGYQNPDGSQNVDKIINYGYRSVHLVAITSKNIMNAYYQQYPVHSYFMGTSNGGREGLMEAQRYPLDFDGILAGAPVWNITGILARFITDQQAQYPLNASNIVITPDKLAIIASAVMQKCDPEDGITDGIISDPIGCNFNPLKDLPICPANTNNSNCVTLQQATVYNTIHTPVFAPYVFDEGYLPGYENSSEALFSLYGLPNILPNLLGSSPDINYALADGYLQYEVYNNRSFDLHNFNLQTNSKDLVLTPSGVNLGQILNADNPVLNTFFKHGGKLIMVHGLADSIIPTESSIQYFLEAFLFNGFYQTQNSLRLYLMPGVFHSNIASLGFDPAVPAQTDYLGALDNWVANGIAPSSLIATGYNSSGVADITRPICPYPQQAVLINPAGSITNASNFKCGYIYNDDDD